MQAGLPTKVRERELELELEHHRPVTCFFFLLLSLTWLQAATVNNDSFQIPFEGTPNWLHNVERSEAEHRLRTAANNSVGMASLLRRPCNNCFYQSSGKCPR